LSQILQQHVTLRSQLASTSPLHWEIASSDNYEGEKFPFCTLFSSFNTEYYFFLDEILGMIQRLDAICIGNLILMLNMI
jgi:hypothetical protein